ncbi:MAG: methionine synthase, partial [bacterium]
AGSKIMTAIRTNSASKDVTQAVIFDATASEIVDEALNWIIDYLNRELRRENKYLTRKRFSAGYADFALSNQEIIYKTLQMKKLGVTLTKNYIMNPEKSVTAITGIKAI